ncbi:MAG: hypothetical protein IJL67_01355, partial [Oscillospiraceae bacterium]|nr:hypothetical protein [Oscillospiraceae bacterium]
TKEHSDYVRKIEDDRKNEKISQLEKDNSQLKEDKNQLKEESERKDKIIAEKDRQLETAEKSGKIKAFIELVKDGKFSVSEAAKYAGMSTEEFEKLM